MFLKPQKIISMAAVHKGSFVADFGFGNGEFLKSLSKEVGAEGKVYAVEIQEDIVKRVSEEFKEKGIRNTEFLKADLEKEESTKIADSSLDFVLVSSVFFQLKDKTIALKEAVRILKPGGRILFIEWKESFSGIGPADELVFSEDEAIVMFKDFPVEMERRLDSGLYHYALVYKKI